MNGRLPAPVPCVQTSEHEAEVTKASSESGLGRSYLFGGWVLRFHEATLLLGLPPSVLISGKREAAEDCVEKGSSKKTRLETDGGESSSAPSSEKDARLGLELLCRAIALESERESSSLHFGDKRIVETRNSSVAAWLDELENPKVIRELVPPRFLQAGNFRNKSRLWDMRTQIHPFCEAVTRVNRAGNFDNISLSGSLLLLFIGLCRRSNITRELKWVHMFQRVLRGLTERDTEFVLSYSGQNLWSEPIEDARTFLLKHQDHFIKATEDLAHLCLRLSKQDDGSPRMDVFRAFERLDAMDDQTLKEYINEKNTDSSRCVSRPLLSLEDKVRVNVSRLKLPDFHKLPPVDDVTAFSSDATRTPLGETLAYLFIGLAGLLNPYYHDTNWPKVLQERISTLNDTDRLFFLHFCGDSWLTTETSLMIKDSNTTWLKLLELYSGLSGMTGDLLLNSRFGFKRITRFFGMLDSPLIRASSLCHRLFLKGSVEGRQEI